jgi:glutamine phosphoribosylpyrophosphate amidotransferase
MCGIFGLWGRVTAAEFAHLGAKNQQRGNRAFGALVLAADSLRANHFPTPFDAAQISLTGAQAVFAHLRAPTGGPSADLRAVHPLESSDFWLAHNGLLLNDADFPQWRIDPDLKLDSQVILGGIQQAVDHGAATVTAIAAVVEKLQGQQACWLWDKRTAALYLWRVMSPLYVGLHADRHIFSSVAVDDLTPQLLEEGRIYQFSADQITRVGHFSFYSPYKV